MNELIECGALFVDVAHDEDDCGGCACHLSPPCTHCLKCVEVCTLPADHEEPCT